ICASVVEAAKHQSYGELVVKYKAEKVCYDEMVKMPLVDLKVLEDESFRMCIDYHELSKMDLYSGCHQMRVHEDEIPRISLRMRYGHFKLTFMPFGLTNAPSVYTNSKEEHESHLKMNLELLKKEKCHVKPNKSYGDLVVKYKAEKVCYEEMVKMPLVDLKVLEDVSFRMCIDYRELSKIDLYSGCHQMRAHEDEILRISLRMRYGHFELTVMPFGLTNAPSVFIELMSHEFGAAEEREVLCDAQQGRSGVKRKLFGSYRNNMGNEPIFALPKGLDNFVVIRRARVRIRA
nr:hypothetical protein [Tanacetum cinerariifolium]